VLANVASAVAFDRSRGAGAPVLSMAQPWPGVRCNADRIPIDSAWHEPCSFLSLEYPFHDSGLENFLLPIRGRDKVQAGLAERPLERAIGVIYRPDTERVSHYFHADLARQFIAVIHLDQTPAVKPLDYSALWKPEEIPETYPFGV
jgi:hypothetical protein